MIHQKKIGVTELPRSLIARSLIACSDPSLCQHAYKNWASPNTLDRTYLIELLDLKFKLKKPSSNIINFSSFSEKLITVFRLNALELQVTPGDVSKKCKFLV